MHRQNVVEELCKSSNNYHAIISIESFMLEISTERLLSGKIKKIISKI
jgi:hypothetical protein